MKYSSHFFVPMFLFLALLLVPITLLAQGSTNTSSPTTKLVATVNLQNARFTQQGRTFTLDFDLSNRVGVQSGVKYAVLLVANTPLGQIIVDEHIYDETLTLGENSNVHKTLTYTAPAPLHGSFALVLSSKSTSGFPFGMTFLDMVTLEEANSDALTLRTESCYLTVQGEAGSPQYVPLQGVDIAPNEVLLSTCELENTTEKELTATPMFNTYVRTTFGPSAPASGGDTTPVTLSPGEKKLVTTALPTPQVPQSYDMTLQYGAESNKIIYHYVIQGGSGTIQNIVLDKDAYAVGEMANVSFFWSKPADTFEGARTTAPTSLVSPTFTIALVSESGAVCAEPYTVTLEVSKSVLSAAIPVTGNCYRPNALVTLADETFGVLSEGTFDTQIEEPTIEGRVAPTPVLDAIGERIPPLWVSLCGLLLGGGLIGYLFYKRRNSPPTTPLAILFLLLGTLFLGAHEVSADTFVMDINVNDFRRNVTYTVNFDKYSYYPGENMHITGSGQVNSDCGNSCADPDSYCRGAGLWISGLDSSPIAPVDIIATQVQSAGLQSVFGAADIAAPLTLGAHMLEVTGTIVVPVGMTSSIDMPFEVIPVTQLAVTVIGETTRGGSSNNTARAFYGEYDEAGGDSSIVTNIKWLSAGATSCSVYRGGVLIGTYAYPSVTQYNIPQSEAIVSTYEYRVDCTSPTQSGSSKITFTAPEKPSNLNVSCGATSNSATFSWTLPSGYTNTHIRAYKTPPASVSFQTACNPAKLPPDGICNYIEGNSFTLEITPGTQYYWFVDSPEPNTGNYSESAGGSSFTCGTANTQVNVALPIPGTTLNVSGISSDGAFAHALWGQNFGTTPDSNANNTASALRLYENGVPLPSPHALHSDIRNIGQGRYSHWVDGTGSESLRFSSLYNSYPLTGGRVYSYTIGGEPDPTPSYTGTAGGTIDITLHFDRIPMAGNYTQFMHLVNGATSVSVDDHVVNSSSWSGSAPDVRTITIPPTLPVGTYDIRVGLSSGSPLPLNAGAGVTDPSGDNRYKVGTLTVTGAAGCLQTTTSGCDLPATAIGGNVSKSCTNMAGSCDYTCDVGGTWIENTNSCVPPMITLFQVCDPGGVNCVNAGNTKLVDPDSPLEVRWASQNTTSCTQVQGTGFSTAGASPTTAGTDDIVSSATPDYPETYQVACQYGAGTPVQSSTIVLTTKTAPELTASKSVVNAGDTVRLNWNTHNGDEVICTLTGGGINGATALGNGTLTSETGYYDIVIVGRTTFTLTCGALSTFKTIEIIPTGWEF